MKTSEIAAARAQVALAENMGFEVPDYILETSKLPLNGNGRKRTVVYGGAFNPPTVAHQVILQECVDFAGKVDADVWLLPSGDRADKRIDSARETRMEYLAAMVEDLNPNKVDVDIRTLELDRGYEVETFDTVIELAEDHPDRDFVWVFGADSTETMAGWKHGRWLMFNVQMLLIERPGSKVNPEVRNWLPLSVPSMDVSSTELRRRVNAGEDFADMVSPTVFKLLTENSGH